MKLSVISLHLFVLASSGMVKALSECASKIDTAQACLYGCGCDTLDINNIDVNKLQHCISPSQQIIPNSTFFQQLDGCCGCNTTLTEAGNCLKNEDEFEDIKTKSLVYLTCIYTENSPDGDNGCGKPELCANILAGGYNQGYQNDFGLNGLIQGVSNATSCEDENLLEFVYDACEVVSGCCEPCASDMAGVANAVLKSFIFPTNSNLFGCAANTTCVNSTARQLEITDDSSLVGPTSINVENSLYVERLADECSDGLVEEIVLYNETYAANNFLTCLYKKMGKIVAETDSTTLESEQSSSISFFFGATSTVLFAIASTVYVIVA